MHKETGLTTKLANVTIAFRFLLLKDTGPGYELVSVSSIFLFQNHIKHKILSQWFIVYCLEWDTQLTATVFSALSGGNR